MLFRRIIFNILVILFYTSSIKAIWDFPAFDYIKMQAEKSLRNYKVSSRDIPKDKDSSKENKETDEGFERKIIKAKKRKAGDAYANFLTQKYRSAGYSLLFSLPVPLFLLLSKRCYGSIGDRRAKFSSLTKMRYYPRQLFEGVVLLLGLAGGTYMAYQGAVCATDTLIYAYAQSFAKEKRDKYAKSLRRKSQKKENIGRDWENVTLNDLKNVTLGEFVGIMSQVVSSLRGT